MASARKDKRRARTAVAVSGDPGTSSLMHEVLTQLGFDVVEVQRGEQVLDALRLEAPDLVVFDGDLPEMGVLNFLSLARPLLGARKVPVVLAREGAQPIERAEGGDLVEVIIHRPFSAQDLDEAVTIARWASDRSNDPRISGGARPSGALQARSGASAPVLPTAPTQRRPRSSGRVATAARPSSAPVSQRKPPVGAALRRDKRQAAVARNRLPAALDERTTPATSQARRGPTPAPPSQTGPSQTGPSQTGPSNNGSSNNGPSRTDVAGVSAPGSKKRFKRTLAFVPAQQPTITTDVETPAPDTTEKTRRPAREAVDRPTETGRRGDRATRRDRPRARSRRRGAQLQPDTLIADRYVVRDLLGTGGMAEVYRVHDRELEEEVALKLLKEHRSDPEIQMRFRQEMRICRRLNHPAIVRTYEFGVWRGRRFITMEVLDGEDMSRVLLRAKGPIPEATVRRLFAQVCRGLDSAHTAGVIHRDVKPHNIFVLTGERQARLMDFGIAKSQDLTTTEAGMSIIGTPAYLPPERLQDGVAPTARTDLYSVGASMYHALTGELPFGGKDISSLLTSILLGDLTPPRDHNPSVSEAMQALVLAAMARSPADRPADCAALADALDALARQDTK